MLGLVETPYLCIYFSVLEMSARLLAITWRKTMYPINKREIPATPKIYDILEALAARHLYFPKVLAARHLYFLKCSLLARKI